MKRGAVQEVHALFQLHNKFLEARTLARISREALGHDVGILLGAVHPALGLEAVHATVAAPATAWRSGQQRTSSHPVDRLATAAFKDWLRWHATGVAAA